MRGTPPYGDTRGDARGASRGGPRSDARGGSREGGSRDGGSRGGGPRDSFGTTGARRDFADRPARERTESTTEWSQRGERMKHAKRPPTESTE